MLHGGPVKESALTAGVEYAISTKQAVVNPKLIAFLTYLKSQPGYDTTILDQHIAEAEMGLCFGYSICFNSMLATGKLTWWFQALVIISNWDGKEASLSDVYDLRDAYEPVTLRQLLERITNYLLYYQKHSFDLDQQKIIASEAREDFPYLERAGASSAKGVEASVERVQDVRRMYANKFDMHSLADALDEARLTGKEVLLAGNIVGKTGELIAHAMSVNYQDGQWYFYNCNRDGFIQTPDKKELIDSVLASVVSLEEVILVDFHGEITLSAKQRKLNEFSQFLKCWQDGLTLDTAHHYLREHQDIKAYIREKPAEVETFFHETFELTRPARLSLWQRSTALSCLLALPKPLPATYLLMAELLTAGNASSNQTLLQSFIIEHPRDFVAISKIVMEQPDLGVNFWYTELMKAGEDILDPLAKSHPKEMEAVADEFASALKRSNRSDAVDTANYIRKLRNLSTHYLAPTNLLADFLAARGAPDAPRKTPRLPQASKPAATFVFHGRELKVPPLEVAVKVKSALGFVAELRETVAAGIGYQC